MSNTRFTPKEIDEQAKTALMLYFEHGGKVKVCKTRARPVNSVSFPLHMGSVWLVGAKKTNLREHGLSAR